MPLPQAASGGDGAAVSCQAPSPLFACAADVLRAATGAGRRPRRCEHSCEASGGQALPLLLLLSVGLPGCWTVAGGWRCRRWRRGQRECAQRKAGELDEGRVRGQAGGACTCLHSLQLVNWPSALQPASSPARPGAVQPPMLASESGAGCSAVPAPRCGAQAGSSWRPSCRPCRAALSSSSSTSRRRRRSAAVAAAYSSSGSGGAAAQPAAAATAKEAAVTKDYLQWASEAGIESPKLTQAYFGELRGAKATAAIAPDEARSLGCVWERCGAMPAAYLRSAVHHLCCAEHCHPRCCSPNAGVCDGAASGGAGGRPQRALPVPRLCGRR